MAIAFPYSPRTGQMEIIRALASNMADRRHIIVQSGTGTGKTICALAAAIGTCAGEGEKVLYLTRTNSQQKQVMAELRAISAIMPVFGVAIQGRRNMCPYIEVNDELKSGTHEELSLLCGQKKVRVMNGDSSACSYFHTLMTADHSAIESWARNTLPTAEEFMAHCSERGFCPYELLKSLAESAKVVTAPYIYFFNPFIQKSLLEWMACQLDDLAVIVDEAHNLPEYARELRTAEMSMGSLRAAEREAHSLGDPEVLEGTSACDFLKMVEEALSEAVGEYVIDDDGLVPSGLLEEALMARLRQTSRGLLRAYGEMVNLGNIVRDKKRKEGALPRSHLFMVGTFLEFWASLIEEEYVKLVVGGENPRFEAYCLDPSIACAPLCKLRASIHMSGTLEPLEEYRDSIGLPKESPTLIFPSPFPRENLMVMYAEDVTSKHDEIAKDEGNIRRMQEYIADMARTMKRNTAVFFPSYSLLERFLDGGQLAKVGLPMFKEVRGMPQDDLMEVVSRFKGASEGALLMAVSGGRISEGIDFPDRELEIAILAGIPYPKPSARSRAVQHFYEVKFGKGWDYAVKAPATRKMLQSIGRLIRSESDRGVALILDKRAVQFRPHISAIPTNDPVGEARSFFSNNNQGSRIKLRRRKDPRPRPNVPEA